jgi:hypothetical protein
MAIEDVFLGAKTGLTLFEAYVNTVTQEIGMERALGLVTKTFEKMGAMQGKMMKEQARIKEFDAKTAWSLLKTIYEGFGTSEEVVEETPKRVAFKVGRCPVYEAGQMLGMDAKSIEAGCRAGSVRQGDAMVKQLNPKLSFPLTKFRSAADDFCVHEIILG